MLAQALMRLGIPSHCRGGSPTTEAEYRDAVIEAGAPLPPWPAVQAEMAAMAAPSPDDVRAEASRRMQALFEARDAAHLTILISNAQREAARLHTLRLGIPGVVEGRDWTAEEAARAVALYAADHAIEAIRAASNALEAMTPVPADYADARWWPGGK